MVDFGTKLNSNTFTHRLIRLVLILLLSALVACNNRTEIAQDRTQAQAVQIVALLNNNGIAAFAEKGKGGAGRYQVYVKDEGYHSAIALIDTHGLAGDPAPSVGDLVAQQGFLPGSRDLEKFRLDLALGLEAQAALEHLNGVVSAKVIVRENYRVDPVNSGASAIILVQEGAVISEPLVRDILQKSLPQVPADRIVINISIFTPQTAQVGSMGARNENGKVINVPLREFLFWHVPEGEQSRLAITFFIVILVSAIFFGLLGYIYAYIKYIRTVVSTKRVGRNTELLDMPDTELNKSKLPEV